MNRIMQLFKKLFKDDGICMQILWMRHCMQMCKYVSSIENIYNLSEFNPGLKA